MIYPLDLLCKSKTDFADLTSIDDLANFLNVISAPYEKLKSINDTFDILDPMVISKFVTSEHPDKVFKKISADDIYLKLLFDINKKEKEIRLRPKIIYTICNDIDILDENMREIKIGNQLVLSIIKISILDLKQLISNEE